MKTIILGLIIVIFSSPISGCACNRKHNVDYDVHKPQPKLYGDVFNWQNKGPVKFIEHLKSGTNSAYIVQGQHYGWILSEDIPALIKLLDSNEPCLSVSMAISSHWDTKGSTVGHEAAYLIEGFRNGVYPHELDSIKWKLEKTEKYYFGQWCDRFINSKPAFTNLQDAVSFMVTCLDQDATNSFDAAFVGPKGRSKMHMNVFKGLKRINNTTPLITLYQRKEFPTNRPAFRLGGHRKELGFIHIVFVNTNAVWQLSDTYYCR